MAVYKNLFKNLFEAVVEFYKFAIFRLRKTPSPSGFIKKRKAKNLSLDTTFVGRQRFDVKQH